MKRYLARTVTSSHLFWQGVRCSAVIHFLGKNNMLFHAHMKDTVFFKRQCCEKYGVLNFASSKPMSRHRHQKRFEQSGTDTVPAPGRKS